MRKSIAPKKNAHKKAREKKINFLPKETLHVGLDVHKKTYSVTLWSCQRDSVIKHWTQPADPKSLIKTLSDYKERVEHTVYEAGPTGYGLVRALRKMDFCADVIAPSRTPQISGQEAKSDRLDSRKLAMWSAKNLLKAVRVPTVQQEEDREIFRMRCDAIKKRRRIKQQIKSFLLSYGIKEPEGLKDWTLKSVAALRVMKLRKTRRLRINMLLSDLDHCELQVKTATSELRKLSVTKRYKKTIEVLRTIPGVGLVTSMAVVTELIDPERFDNERQVAAIAGLAPKVSTTGETTHQGHLMKCGNVRLRTALIEAAWCWKRRDPWAAQVYRRMMVNTRNEKKAIAALARRLLIILWRIRVTGEPYRPRPCESEGENGEATVLAKPCQPGLPNKKKGGKQIEKQDAKKRTVKRASSRSRQRPLSVQSPK